MKVVHQQHHHLLTAFGVLPQKPVTLSFRNYSRNARLRIHTGNNPEVNACSLRFECQEMTSLNLEVEGPEDVVFSVKALTMEKELLTVKKNP